MKWLLLAALLSGCSAEHALDAKYAPEDTAGGEIPAGTLRLDVLPPTSAGAGTLLAQSSIVRPGAYEGLAVELLPTRTLVGTLSAEVARGWTFGAPTTLEPLVATLQQLPGDGRLGGVTSSLEDGSFSLSFPSYPGAHPIAIVPADPSMAPFRVVDTPATDAVWAQVLEPGIPVYGRVTGVRGADESGVAGVSLRLARTVGDDVVRSGVFTTDATGWYVARVDELGEYTLEVLGGQTTHVEDGNVAPTLSVPVLVEEETGIEVPVALGAVEAARVDGLVLDPDGEPVFEPRLRFTATELDGGGELVVEAIGQSGGDFIVRELLPGTYDLEIMPPPGAEPTATPLRVSGIRVSGATGLGTYRLPPATRLEGRVEGASGVAAAQVLVVATEVGFGGNVWYTYTDGSGRFDLAVPDVPLTLTLTPATTVDGAVTTIPLDAPARDLALTLDLGVLVSGTLAYEGQPVAFGSVEVRDAGSGALLGQAISGSDGTFSLRVSIPEESDTDIDAEDTGDEEDGGDSGGADTGDTADTAEGADTAEASDTADTAR